MTKMLKIQTVKAFTPRIALFIHLPVVVLFAVLLSFLFLFPSFAASEIYKWKDSNGNMIFSDSRRTDRMLRR